MAWALEPTRIEGQRVSIRTYTADDIGRIAKAVHDPTDWFGRKFKLETIVKDEELLATYITGHRKGEVHPLVYEVGGQVAGITRLMRIEASHRVLEIGGTRVATPMRKSFVNTEVKYLLLKHCFESLSAERVEFRVDTRNTNSQRAVLRIGAVLEGRLRNRWMAIEGTPTDCYLFSVIKPEWPQVAARLLGLMGTGTPCKA